MRLLRLFRCLWFSFCVLLSIHSDNIINIIAIVTANAIDIPHTNNASNTPIIPSVRVFHYVIDYWGESYEGNISCDASSIDCRWMHADQLKTLKHKLENVSHEFTKNTITVGLFNIHSWWERVRDHKPPMCEFPTNLTIAESEESRQRYNGLFEPSFKHFDGTSTTQPSSSVQRVYKEAFLPESDFVPRRPFKELIKAAAYVASDCHKRDNANANRDGIVKQLKQLGLRVDGLGRCMHSIGPEGIQLPNTPEARYNLTIKREIISHFMFYLAFENSIEAGYVTEKPFDGLLSGVVPVYLGDSQRLRALLPHPKSVLFVSDYEHDLSALVSLMKYLMTNETAYESYRSWRDGYSSRYHASSHPALATRWPCQICEWAAEAAKHHHKRGWVCGGHHNAGSVSPKLLNSSFSQQHQHSNKHSNGTNTPGHHNDAHSHPHNHALDSVNAGGSTSENAFSKWDGKIVRGNSRTVYLVKHGHLHMIPDIATFSALKFDFQDVLVLEDSELKKIPIGLPLPKQRN